MRRIWVVRLDIIGASLGSQPSLPALNTVTLGSPDPSRLLLPVLPKTSTPT